MRSTFAPEPWPQITIVRASVGDALVLTRVAAALFEQTFAEVNTPEDMSAYLAGAFSEDRQRRELADDCNVIWLARDAHVGAIAGYAHVRLGTSPPCDGTSRGAEIVRLYAHRRWHGRGVGAMLMRSCIAAAREYKASVLWLGVWEHNARAIDFYEKTGFRVIGEHAFILGSDRQRDLVMALDLARDS